MIEFQRPALSVREQYNAVLFSAPERGCEYSFANLVLWGRQNIAFLHGCAARFSHFNGKTVYPYPVGTGDKQAVLALLHADADARGIPMRLTGMTAADCAELEALYPGQFHILPDRDSYDYVYSIDDLADLRGRKFQKKRNHFNRFQANHPDYRVEPLSCKNLGKVQEMVNDWYLNRRNIDPDGDYLLESLAMARAFRMLEELELEGLALMEGEQVLAVTMGSRMGEETYDIHFEKAREDVDGAYTAINCEFARYLRLKHPDVKYLNREDDVGLEGLRKAKLSYNPHHMVEKYRAVRREDLDED
jgi:hypothetical protein